MSRSSIPRLAAFVGLALAAPAAAEPAIPANLKVERIAPVADALALPLYPGMRAGEVTERWNLMFDGKRAVRNVTVPTLTPVLPEPAKATGAAIVVIPGGAFKFVSMDNEGWPVARWLADRGIAAFVLKYRTNETPDDESAMMADVARVFAQAAKSGTAQSPRIAEPRATEDAIAALRMVRSRAGAWRVDPARVGLLGFSAGAMTALNVAASPSLADRPAWLGYIYGRMTRTSVPAGAPPMFAAIAFDDGLFGRQGLGLAEAWREANRPIELHVYERGDHGFGMGRPGTTSTLMLEQYLKWLETNGWLRGQQSGRQP